jgi:hypothetical protein
LFASVQAQAAREQSSWLGVLRAKATVARRLVVLTVLSAIVALELGLHAREAFAQAPLRVGFSLAAFGALMVMLLMSSLRPIHQPALSRRSEAWLVAGPLLVAIGLSLWPTLGASGTLQESLADAWSGAKSCLLYGLAVAVPVYLVARLVDRGGWVTGVLAALGAGLAANFVLMTHCPMAGPEHMMLGHFGVIVVLLLASAAWSRFRRLGAR